MKRLERLMTALTRETGASAGLLYLLPPGERTLWLALAEGIPERITAPVDRVSVDAVSPVPDCMRQGRLLWRSSREQVARHYPQLGLVVPYDFMLAAAPFTSDTAVKGGVALLWPVKHPPQLSSHQREAITMFCEDVVMLLKRSDDRGSPLLPPAEPLHLLSHGDEADRAWALAALRCAERLPFGCCALDLEGRITYINSAGIDLVGADGVSLTGARPFDALPWLRTPVPGDCYRAAVVTRQPTSFIAVRPPDTPLRFELYPDDSGISVHITPSTKPPEAVPVPPSGEPTDALALYQLMHLAATLTEALNVQDVTTAIREQIVPAFEAQGMVLMSAEEGRLHILGHQGYSADYLSRFDDTPLAADTPTTRSLTAGEPAFFSTFDDLKWAYPDAPRHETRNAWAFLPLTVSDRPIGSLVLSFNDPRPFPPARRALLSSVTGLIAEALDRARLYDTKHALAHSLQCSLLPHTLPRVDGLEAAARYRPGGRGMDIGGDFYDLIRVPPTATAAIGDVQGHNATAAALMGQVRTAVHAHATVGTSPGELLTRTNQLLTDLDADLFASCLIANLDLAHHRARIASAGHPLPLLRHPDGHTEVLRPQPGLLLGIDPDIDYPTTDISFPPGAVLVLYTDGLVEIPGTDIGDTTDALARHLAETPCQNLDDLADHLVRHAQRSAPRYDDIALLLLRPTR
ncbi:SpoIIE family protein phosphatase [Streptomyces sp. RM72]|uniref:SpoIIE family protein phosphatase n=1 Tax=Streptomyces sp. RM72 TaxID=1115510 RepID=UPI001B36E80F|nr:SpoIIE family protein phosphatase [Streptomyces sp. RM72]MBQ0887111.1 SpoIIE family protein phosphatase [Streptomyces sp. RM72]